MALVYHLSSQTINCIIIVMSVARTSPDEKEFAKCLEAKLMGSGKAKVGCRLTAVIRSHPDRESKAVARIYDDKIGRIYAKSLVHRAYGLSTSSTPANWYPQASR